MNLSSRALALSLVLVFSLFAGCAGSGGGASPGAGRSSQADNAKRAQARFDLAAAYFAQGQNEVALEEINRSISANDESSRAFNLKALILANMGDERGSEESFKRALQLNSLDADVLQNYAWFSCQLRRYTEAESLFQQALRIPGYRDAARTLLTSGICQARAGQLREAEKRLSAASERGGPDPAVFANLADVLFRLGEYERARFQIRRVNSVPEWVTAQTLWLAIRIEHRLGNESALSLLGAQLRNKFPQAPELMALERRKFDE